MTHRPQMGNFRFVTGSNHDNTDDRMVTLDYYGHPARIRVSCIEEETRGYVEVYAYLTIPQAQELCNLLGDMLIEYGGRDE